MAKPASSVAKAVSSRARSLGRYLQRVEALHASGSLSLSDVERAYSGVMLEFYAFVERSIEELFLGLLRGRLVSSNKSVRPLIKVKSDLTARAIVQGGRPYVDWLPYKDYTLRRAEAFFSSGRPFSLLERSDIDAFEDAALIRNALAHQSASALRRFGYGLVVGRSLPPREHRPAPYLRGQHTIGQTRMNYMLARLANIMTKLCT